MQQFTINKLFSIILLFAVGSVSGYHIGTFQLAKTVTGASAISFFITKPLAVYGIVNEKLYKVDPLQRLVAYYALWDLNIVDTKFLYERYKEEDTIAAKRTILQILALQHSKKFLQFLDEVYELSDKNLKMQMVKIVKQQYPEKLDAFAQKHKVDAQWIHTD